MRKEIQKYIIENFGGGVKSDIAGIYVGDSFVPESLNVDFSIKKGAARKRKGYVRMNSGTGLDSAITGMYEDKFGGSWKHIITAGSKVYDWDQAADSAAEIGTGLSSNKNYLFDFATAVTTTDGAVILMTNGVDQIKKYDGTTFSNLSLSEGYNYFKAKYCTMFMNYCFFANTNEGANLADTWTNTAGTIYSYDNTDSAFSAGLDIAEVYNNTTALTEETATPTAPASGEYGVSAGVFYVNIGGAPSTNIHITYRNYERVRWMDIGNAEGYTSTNFLDAVTTFGKGIKRIVPLRDLLIVYKEDSIWAIYYTGDSTAPFGIYCIDHNTPCISGFSVADVKGDHFFLSEEGIMKTNGAKVEPVLVSKNVPEWFKLVSKDDWIYSYAATNEYYKQYRLLIPNKGATDTTDKDREIRYDYEDGTWSVHEYAGHANIIGVMLLEETGTWDSISRYWDEIDVSWDDPSLWAHYTRFFTGDYSGFLRMHDHVERDDEGTDQAIESYIITKPLNLSQNKQDVGMNKRLHKLTGRFESFSGSTLTIYTRLDRKGDFASAGTIDCGQTGREFNASIDLSGTCKEIEYKIGNNASIQPWTVFFIETSYILRTEK